MASTHVRPITPTSQTHGAELATRSMRRRHSLRPSQFSTHWTLPWPTCAIRSSTRAPRSNGTRATTAALSQVKMISCQLEKVKYDYLTPMQLPCGNKPTEVVWTSHRAPRAAGARSWSRWRRWMEQSWRQRVVLCRGLCVQRQLQSSRSIRTQRITSSSKRKSQRGRMQRARSGMYSGMAAMATGQRRRTKAPLGAKTAPWPNETTAG